MKTFKTIANFVKKHLFLSLLVLIIVGVAAYFFSPFDGLPGSVKWSKTVHMAGAISSGILGIEDAEFKPSQNELYDKSWRLILAEYWLWEGLDLAEIDTALETMNASDMPREHEQHFDTVAEYGPGNWIYEFSQLGAQHETLAQEAEQAGDTATAKEQYLKTALYYKLGAYPLIFRETELNYHEEATAYENSLNNYEKAGQYFDYPLERVEITVDGKPTFGYLHLPKTVETQQVPVVISTSGPDVYMVELYPFAQALNEKGIALLTFDLPGAGANAVLTLTPEMTRFHSAFIDALVADKRIDPNRIAAAGFSFGGNAATRLAFIEEDRIAAVVNFCGPLDQLAYVPAIVIEENVPPMTRKSLANRMEIQDDHQYQQISQALNLFGLVSQGIIKEGAKTSVPIFTINTPADPFGPIWEMELITRISEGGEMVIASGDGHCPSREETMPQVVTWLVDKLQ